jgi:3-deoxy-7-phosphoheptulonate synthase
MLIVMKPQASEQEIRNVCQKIEALGLRAHPIPGAQRTAIEITAIAAVLGRTTARSLMVRA